MNKEYFYKIIHEYVDQQGTLHEDEVKRSEMYLTPSETLTNMNQEFKNYLTEDHKLDTIENVNEMIYISDKKINIIEFTRTSDYDNYIFAICYQELT